MCDTYFLLTGDRFLRAWNKADSVESVTTFTTKAVACASTAQLIDYYGEDSDSDSDSDDGDDGDNDDESDTGIPEEPLSAPVHIIFKGYHSFPSSTGFSRWEMATDQDFEDVVPFPQDEVDYVFNDFGTYYMRYMVTNSENSCPAYGTTYTIIVSESYMPIPAKMPNVLSQGLTKWKVKTKSLIEFHCWIYNRWGKLVYEFTDPDGEWDGTYNGRPLDTGVYYYVITAKGNDGVSYKRRGDINILKYKGNSGSGIGGGGMDNPSGY